MMEKEKKEKRSGRLQRALTVSAEMVKAVDKGEKAYHVFKKYVLPVVCVGFALIAYAVYDVDMREETEKK